MDYLVFLRRREVAPQSTLEFNPRYIPSYEDIDIPPVSHLQPRRLRVHATRKFEPAEESRLIIETQSDYMY